MGIWNKLKETYKKIDTKVGGYLPGGVKPGESEPSQSTSSTDAGYAGGEAAHTTPSGYTPPPRSGGGSTPAPNMSTPSGEVYAPPPSTAPNMSTPSGEVYAPPPRGSEITPSKTAPSSSISASTYTGEPPQRVKQSFTSALGTSFKNTLNLGVIGTQGFGAYTKQAFLEPFRYVGSPKAYSEVGTNVNPEWRGTPFGEGMSKEQKDIYTPDIYKDTTGQTYFDVSETQKKELYGSAGLAYTGEPARLLPQRLGESVTKDLTPKYEAKLESGTEEIFDYYQGQVNVGKLTTEQAQTEFTAASDLYAGSINKEFQTEFSSSYDTRFKNVGGGGGIARAESFQKEIGEPGAFPVIKNIGRGVEAGAIIGATAFGGSGATIAASTYLGTKTASQALRYKADFGRMTTKQKIIGGGSLAFGAAASASIGGVGRTKFYREWRGIIYKDLARQPATVSGGEVLKIGEMTRFNIKSVRSSGVNQAITFQRTDIYKTGANRLGAPSKGVTYTKILDPETSKYIYSSKPYFFSGGVTDIKQGMIGYKVGKTTVVTNQEAAYGIAAGRINVGGKITPVRSTVISQEGEGFYNVAGGSLIKQKLTKRVLLEKDILITPKGTYHAQVYTYDSTIKSRLSSFGKIRRAPPNPYSNYKVIYEKDSTVVRSLDVPGETKSYGIKVSSSAKSQVQYLKNLYSVGDAASAEIARQAQVASIKQITTPAIGGATSGTAIVSARALTQPTSQKYSVATQTLEAPRTETRQISYQLPTLSQMGLSSQQSLVPIMSPYTATTTLTRQSVIPIQSPALASAQALSPRLKTSLLSPLTTTSMGSFVPGVPPSGYPIGGFIMLPRLSPGYDSLGSNILKGGQKIVRYSPSFSAILFNVRGSAPATKGKTGIGFRPIVKGFRYKTGLSFSRKGWRLF